MAAMMEQMQGEMQIEGDGTYEPTDAPENAVWNPGADADEAADPGEEAAAQAEAAEAPAPESAPAAPAATE